MTPSRSKMTRRIRSGMLLMPPDDTGVGRRLALEEAIVEEV
jgi:hypothetical protein